MIINNKWFKQSAPDDNLCAASLNLLYHLKVPFYKKKVKSFLYSQQTYPHLISVENLLKDLSIDCLIVKISQEELRQINTPLIAHISENKSFVVIIEVLKNNVRYINSISGYSEENIESFSKRWSGYVLLAETNSLSGRNHQILINNHRRNKLLFFVFIALLFFFSLIRIRIFEDFNSLSYFSVLTLILIGIIISASIVINNNIQRIGEEYSKFHKTFFFQGFHPNLGCNKSSYSLKFFKKQFFLEDLTSILFFVSFVAIYSFPNLMNLPEFIKSFLIVLFLYLLFFTKEFYNFCLISKQFCVPKLGLLLIIMSLVFIFIIKWTNVTSLESEGIICVSFYFLSFLFSAFGYLAVKNQFIKLLQLKTQNSKLNYLVEVDNFSIKANEEKLTLVPKASEFELYLGNPFSDKIITLVINPINKASLEYLVEAQNFSSSSKEYKIQILLYSDTLEAKVFTKVISNISVTEGNNKAVELLFEWLENQSSILSVWLEKNKVYANTSTSQTIKINEQIDMWKSFVEKELRTIPAILCKGRLLPKSLSFKGCKNYFEN